MILEEDQEQPNGHLVTDHTSDLAVLLGKFQCDLSISPLKPTVPSSSSAVIKSKCLQFIKSNVHGVIGVGADAKFDFTDDGKVLLMLKCFKVLSETYDEIEDDVVKLQNEFILDLIKTGKYQEALSLIYSTFRQINNLVSKFKLVSDEVCLEKLIHGLSFNVFNLKYAKHITNNYLLLVKLVVQDTTSKIIPSQSFLLLFNLHCYNWFNSLNDPKPMVIMKKSLINYSNRCKSVLKLNFLIKALLFTQGEDQMLYEHFGSTLDKLIKIDDKMTYQYTSQTFSELLHLKPLSANMNRWISQYLRIKLKYNEHFTNEDINWLRFLDKKDSPSLGISDIMDRFDHDGNLEYLINNIEEGQDWVLDKASLRKLIKCNIKAIKMNNQQTLKLLTFSLQLLLEVEFESKYMIEFLNYVTNHIKDLNFDIQLNDVIKRLANLYRKYNKIDKFRNLSNICFQNGGKLMIPDFKESLNQWMDSVNYEYNILNNNFSLENFNFFKMKIDRISNLLIENKKYHESKIFLMKVFHCYFKLNSTADFLQLENSFNKDLNISLKLLIKSTILSKSLDLQSLDETLRTLITSGILGNVQNLNIDGKTIIINDIMDNLKKNIKDRGLFQYLLIKYYNLIGLDSFLHVNYKEFNEKEFPQDSRLFNYKELIICFNYLQYTINRAFNQTIIIRCVDLFRRWITVKPSSLLSNNEILFNLEWSFVKTLTSFLQYQHLHIYIIKIIKDFLKIRSPILKNHQLTHLHYVMVSALAEMRFPKLALAEFDSMKHSDKINFKILEFQLNLDLKNDELSVSNFKNVLGLLNHEIPLVNDNKLKIVQNLILFAKFSYFSSVHKFYLADPIGSIIDLRRGIRLGKVILTKYISQLSNITMNEFNSLKWEISSMLIKSLRFGIDLMIHCGMTKNCLYYLDEFLIFLDAQQIPMVKCYGFYAIAEFYLLSKKFIKANEFMIKSDEIYNGLEFEDNFLELKGLAAHSFYFQMIGDFKNEKIYGDKVNSFYKDLQTGKLDLEFTKLLKDDSHCFNILQLEIDYKTHFKIHKNGNTDFSKRIHLIEIQRANIIKAKKNLMTARHLLNSDPVLSGLEESVMAIPSTMSSTRESVITHKLVINLSESEMLLMSTLKNNWRSLKLFEIYDLSKALIYLSTLKSSISTSTSNLIDFYKKDDMSRFLPFEFDRQLANMHEDNQQLLPNLEASIFQCEENSLSDLKRRLPDSWLVILLDICPQTGNLLLTRFEKDIDNPLVVQLPLMRASTGDVDRKYLTFDDAMKELQRIINESNATTKAERISQIKTREDKLKWWDDRKKLDQDLSTLLGKVELNWIGGFKGIFSQTRINSNLKLEFKQKFDIILNQYLPSRFNKKSKANNKIDIHDQILETFFLNLPLPLDSTDLLEDLIYFLLDILLFHGEENSFDELDIDHMYIDIEELLMKYHDENILREFNNYEHTVLIVAKECCNFPWESLPCLRNLSISRLPSLKMLNDLLAKNEDLKLSKSNGSYIINPNNDLSNTETNFKEKFTSLPNWDGIIGTKPTEQQFKSLLTDSNLLVYIGHGSGDQYIRSSTIKSINDCSPSLLIGCSSGILHENGMLEPYGTVYNHLVAGSPMVLVNLWDVTDKDIDKFTIAVFDKWGLFNNKYNSTITQLIASSRDECNLKYLNGAAPILYGLPFMLMD